MKLQKVSLSAPSLDYEGSQVVPRSKVASKEVVVVLDEEESANALSCALSGLGEHPEEPMISSSMAIKTFPPPGPFRSDGFVKKRNDRYFHGIHLMPLRRELVYPIHSLPDGTYRPTSLSWYVHCSLKFTESIDFSDCQGVQFPSILLLLW